MKDLARRFPENPLLMPQDLKASREVLQIISLLNPVVFHFQGKVYYSAANEFVCGACFSVTEILEVMAFGPKYDH